MPAGRLRPSGILRWPPLPLQAPSTAATQPVRAHKKGSGHAMLRSRPRKFDLRTWGERATSWQAHCSSPKHDQHHAHHSCILSDLPPTISAASPFLNHVSVCSFALQPHKIKHLCAVPRPPNIVKSSICCMTMHTLLPQLPPSFVGPPL